MSKGRPALRLEVPSESGFLGLVREVTRKMAEVAGFEDKTADQLALAVDEAATNVLEHAYHGAPDRVVRVDMDDRGESFCVDVVDDGESFDPAARPSLDVRQMERDRRTGGLGVHLMERIMDSVTWKRREPLNVCCLVKRKRSA
ncbi:MAG TPA: ATP-binding protein [Vicinamibacteria bacterium]